MPDDIGPSAGAVPSGISASRSFSRTIWRAVRSFIASSKVSSTTDRPKIVRERRPMTCGTLPSERSIGMVTSCSTSSAA